MSTCRNITCAFLTIYLGKGERSKLDTRLNILRQINRTSSVCHRHKNALNMTCLKARVVCQVLYGQTYNAAGNHHIGCRKACRIKHHISIVLSNRKLS